MKIAVLGTGHVGGTLGRRWAEKGHQVTFGSRDPQSDRVKQLLAECPPGVAANEVASAVSDAEVVVLAVPWTAAKGLIEAAGDLSGKILIDCINPLNATFDGLDLGFEISASEKIAQWAPRARVVKAFNTVSSATMADPVYGDLSATVFYCGDDEAAGAVVHGLAEDLGLEAVDAGPLTIARHLEPLAMLYIHLAIKQGWGSNCAFKIVKRPKSD